MHMNSVIDLIKKHVDLNGYSRSKGFIGFSERNKKFSYEISMKMISFLLSYFDGQLHKFKLVNSLHFSDRFEKLKNDYDVSKEQYELLTNLQKAGWIRAIDYTDFGFNYDSDEYQDNIELLYITFFEHDISKENIKYLEQLLTAVFSIDGLDGHCFIISDDLGIIIYPHEDTGFGVISFKGKEAEELGKQFLLSFDSIDGIITKIAS